jgi:hypothetical protein
MKGICACVGWLLRDFSVVCQGIRLNEMRHFFMSDRIYITLFSVTRGIARTQLSLHGRADSVINSLQIDLFDNNFSVLPFLSSLSDFSGP